MQSSDRPDFEKLVAKLCAGFEAQAPTPERIAAYVEGLDAMSLIEFSRVVDFALSEAYADEFSEGGKKRPRLPNVPLCWQIRKRFRARPEPKLNPAPIPPRKAPIDHLVLFANRLMVRHVIWREGLGERELDIAIAAKNELVTEFAAFVREGDELATKGEFVRLYMLALERAGSRPSPRRRWEQLLEDKLANDCFPASAADGIDSNGQLQWAAA